jgi:phage shock protein PspC (stress-responsive transcriptional regulator)
LIATIALLISGKGVLGVAAGIGLLKRAAWARALALFLAFLSLFELPFGTALAIYTIWVLLSPNADQQYRALAASG